MQRFLAVFKARNLEFIRDRSALAWNIVLPVLLVMGFAFAFAGDRLDLYKVGVHGDIRSLQQEAFEFSSTDYIQFIPVDDIKVAIEKIEHHQLDLLIDTQEDQFWVNELSPNGHILERVLYGTSSGQYQRNEVSGRRIRYVDWLVPGILAINMMFSALFGVGYVIVRYRKEGVLKRLKATPLSAFEFLSAQVASRLAILMLITIFVYVSTDLFVNFIMLGSYVDLLIVYTLGAISLICLGLLIASRIANQEVANGVLNLISWPMMFLSGVWFSLEGLHPIVQKISLIFPLTHIIEGGRAIMIDGAGLEEITLNLAALVLMSVVFLAIGSYMFRWQ